MGFTWHTDEPSCSNRYNRMAKSKSRQRCLICCGLLCVAGIITVCCLFFLPPGPSCSDGTFTRGAVAADSKLCSDIGRDMLQKGGSAVDAAIAALICTGLVNPQSMGLGGGSIFTIRDKAGKVTVISSRETVPKTFKPNLMSDCEGKQFYHGAQWIGVPGELRGYKAAHDRFGKLKWEELFAPSIRLAREGFPMPPYLFNFISHPILKPLIIGTQLCELFCHANKTLLSTKDILRYPKLADTMETIAKQGAEAFYTGTIAHDIIDDIRAAGGSLTLEDLKSFRVRHDDALKVPMGDYTMHIPPPPAGGAILTFVLNIMKGYNLSPASLSGKEKVRTFQRLIEACKFANGQKKNVKDPEFHSVDVSNLIKEDFAAKVRGLISSEKTHNASYYDMTPSRDQMGTTHVSVIAGDGTAVSVTSTINQMFGSLVYSKKTGIILNNELGDFCNKAGDIRPGEQPPSSMAPVILRSESLDKTLVIGGSGGSLITSAMALSIVNHLWLGMSLEDAITSPIVFVDGKNKVSFESNPKVLIDFDKDLKEDLLRLGHVDGKYPFFLNVVNAAMTERGCIRAVSDRRKLGKASCY
ncbi:glutathione hydrolase 5 proenzyme [Alosa pseudoharengus]|uniref:glutathione hydrolase 5 proenzyme n=1 Tax=Alosa pseudoharengus TaxID=34774 RepID=UPI003F8BA1CC